MVNSKVQVIRFCRTLPLILGVVFAIHSCGIIAKQEKTFFSETQIKGDTITHFKTMASNVIVGYDTLRYHWVKGGLIHSTPGGFHGRLLNGSYKVLVNDNLIELGYFKNGLKHGVWKTWSNNRLLSTYTWKNGLLCGKFELYDENGRISKHGKYRNGRIVKPTLWPFGGKKG